MIDDNDIKELVIYPFFKYKIYWDIFVIFILISSIILTPIDLGFPDIRNENDILNYFMYLIDIIFLFDLIMNFFSAFEDDQMILIDDRKKILKSYFQGWFLIDFCSIFPIDIILSNAFPDSSQSNQNGYNKLIRITRIGKVYKLVRIVKLKKLIENQQKKSENKNLIGLH